MPSCKVENSIFLLVGSASCFYIPAKKAKNNHGNLLPEIVSINLTGSVFEQQAACAGPGLLSTGSCPAV